METLKDVGKWMPCPKKESQHPGLAYMSPLSQLIVAKKLDTLHEIIGSKGISYTIFNNEGQKVFLAVQENHYRKFNVKIYNNYGNEVIEVKRPFKLCINRVLVWAPPGNFVGSVVQVKSSCNTFLVQNRKKKTVLKIVGNGSYTFVYDIKSREEKIGEVGKELRIEKMLDVTNFGVSFPEHMDVGEKAVLLGASFLIGYLKFGNKGCIP